MGARSFAADGLPPCLTTWLGDALSRCETSLVQLWWQLGPDGPTLGSPSSGLQASATTRYLLPLARTLRGALRGSQNHLTVYLDERTRYCDSTSDLRRALGVELPRVAQLLAPDAASEALRLLEDLHAPLLEPPPPGTRVLFVGDCLFVEIRAFVRAAFDERPTVPEIEHVFSSAQQGLDDVEGATATAIRDFRPDLIGVSLFTFEGLPLFRATMHDNATAWRRADLSLVPALVSALQAELASIRAVTDATVVIHAPCGIPLDRVRRRLPAPLPAHSRAQRRVLEAVRNEVTALVEATENALLLDESVRVGGAVRTHAQPLFTPSDVPEGYFHTTKLGPALAEDYVDFIESVDMLRDAKALLVDFDNTLWEGVMGEGPVKHHATAQRLLRELKDAGVLLIALSKNDESAIRWDEMEVKPEDFVLRKINWAPKPDNVSAAIRELDLAPETFVLLDDNPVERSLVGESIPGMKTLDPTDPTAWVHLRRWLDMPSTKRTAEAATRTEMYRQAVARRSAVGDSHDYPTMMRSLNLRSSIRSAVPGDMDRLLELVQRTNQFNTTTRRRSAAEIQELVHDEGHGLWVATLSDRFGDLGIVAAGVFDRRQRLVDSFIMSCRAMGFGLETALLRTMLEQESLVDVGPVRGLFVPTERNRPASALFRDNGFQQVDVGVWQLAAPRLGPAVPPWLTISVEASTARD